jgi:hypothetical protein
MGSGVTLVQTLCERWIGTAYVRMGEVKWRASTKTQRVGSVYTTPRGPSGAQPQLPSP